MFLIDSKKHTYTLLALSSLALLLASLACQVNLGGPEPPGPPIPVSPDAAEQLKELWASAAADPNGQVILILNETQVTSFLAFSLAKQESPIIQEPQVYLRQGSIQVFGRTERGLVNAIVRLIVAPRVTPEGHLSFEIASADFGPIPAPEALRSGLSSMLTEAFAGSLGPFATGLRIETVAVADGQMAIVGSLR